jgi:hypothetical protein
MTLDRRRVIGVVVGIVVLALVAALLLLARNDRDSREQGAIAVGLQFYGFSVLIGADSNAGPTWILTSAIQDTSSSPISIRSAYVKVDRTAQVNFVGIITYKNMAQAIDSGHLGGGSFGWNAEFGDGTRIENLTPGYQLSPGRVYQLVVAWSLKNAWSTGGTDTLTLSVSSQGVDWSKTVPFQTVLCPLPGRALC